MEAVCSIGGGGGGEEEEEEKEGGRSQRMKNSRLHSRRGRSCPADVTAHMIRKFVTTRV